MSGTALPPDVRRWLCLAGRGQNHVRAMPLVWARPPNSRAQGRTRGVAQIDRSQTTAGQSHPLTSGGGADPRESMAFEVEPAVLVTCAPAERYKPGYSTQILFLAYAGRSSSLIIADSLV